MQGYMAMRKEPKHALKHLIFWPPTLLHRAILTVKSCLPPPPPSYECENAGGGFPQNPHEKNRNEWGGMSREKCLWGKRAREPQKHKFRKSFKFSTNFTRQRFWGKRSFCFFANPPGGGRDFHLKRNEDFLERWGCRETEGVVTFEKRRKECFLFSRIRVD